MADQIEKLVWEVYGICHETLTEYFTSQKVVAAFVMKQSSKDIGKVVSIGTGHHPFQFFFINLNNKQRIRS